MTKEKPTKEELERVYLNEGNSIRDTAKKLGKGYTTVHRWLIKYDIPLRGSSLAEPSKEELEKWYVDEKLASPAIAEKLGVSNSTVTLFLEKNGIKRRTRSEAQLPRHFIEPSKEDLEGMYLERKMTIKEIKNTLGVSTPFVRRLLQKYGIPVKDFSGGLMVSKEEMDNLYTTQKKIIPQIAKEKNVSPKTVGNWLKFYGIKIRSRLDYLHPEGANKPSKKELEKMYFQEDMSINNIAKRLGFSKTSIKRWSKEYGIGTKRPVTSNQQFIDFLSKDKTARDLATLALSLNGESYDVEQIISRVYEGKFGNQEQLHKLIQDNSENIYSLMEKGITNLGNYIGEFSLGDKSILPVLLGEALANIPENKMTQNLEDRLIRILRTTYSPKFNTSPKETISELGVKLEGSNGRIKGLYQKLREHYQEVLNLEGELNA